MKFSRFFLFIVITFALTVVPTVLWQSGNVHAEDKDNMRRQEEKQIQKESQNDIQQSASTPKSGTKDIPPVPKPTCVSCGPGYHCNSSKDGCEPDTKPTPPLDN